MWSRAVSIAVAAALGSVAAAARAQTVPVEIEADRPGLSIRLLDLDRPGTELSCGARCALSLPAGDYSLEVRDAAGAVAARKLVVRRPSHVTVTPPSEAARITGSNMRFGGAVIATVGSAMVFYALFKSIGLAFSCNGTCTDESPAWIGYAGAAGLVGGGALAMAGMMVERSNSKPHLEVTHPAPAPGAGLRLSPAAGPRWTGLALTGRF